MRTIKFRGRSIHSDVWCYGSLADYGEDEFPEICGFDIFTENDERWREEKVEPETIGQFTGLFDKNGKEIYEGDICRMEYGKRFVYMEVVWHEKDAHFGFRLSGENNVGCSDTFSEWIRQKRVDVVGNIIETPVLLKGG